MKPSDWWGDAEWFLSAAPSSEVIACHASTGGKERPFQPDVFYVFIFFMNLSVVRLHNAKAPSNSGNSAATTPTYILYPFHLNTGGRTWAVFTIGCVSVFQYRIGQLYMISKHSHEQSDRGEGVEVVQNEPFEDPEHGQGQFTEKRVYLNRSAFLLVVAGALLHT